MHVQLSIEARAQIFGLNLYRCSFVCVRAAKALVILCKGILFKPWLLAYAISTEISSTGSNKHSMSEIGSLVSIILTLWMLGNFACSLYHLLIFFYINIFEKFSQEYYESVKQFGSANCLQCVISRRKKLPLACKE